MEQSVSTYKKIRRLYRQSQKYAASRMEQPELTQSELQLLRHVGFHGEVSQRHLADEMGVDPLPGKGPFRAVLRPGHWRLFH